MLKKLLNNKFIRGGSLMTLSMIICQAAAYAFNFYALEIMGREGYGQYSIYMKGLSILNILVTVNLSSSIIRGKQEFEEEFGEFFSNIATVGVAFILILWPLFIFLFSKISHMTFMEQYFFLDSRNLLIIMGVHSVLLFVFNLYITRLTAEFKYEKQALVNFLKTIGTFLVTILIFSSFSGNRFHQRIAGVIILLGVIVLFAFKENKFFTYKIKKKYIAFAVLYSSPLIIHSLGSVLLNFFDEFVIRANENSILMNGEMLSSGSQGLYTFAYRIGSIITAVWVVFNKLWTPWFFEKMKKEEYQKIKRAAFDYVNIFSFVFLGYLMVVPETRIFTSVDNHSAFIYVPIIAIGCYFVFLNSFLTNIEFYNKKTQYISLGTMVSLVLNVVLNLIMIPRFGPLAAAVTTLISYVVLFFYHVVLNDIVLKSKVFSMSLYLRGIVFSGTAIILYYCLLDYTFIRWGIVVLTAGFILINYRRKLSWLN